MNRRDFMQMAAALGALSSLSSCASRPRRNLNSSIYDFAPSGNMRILHMTDTHAQLLPVYFREPSVNLGFNSVLNTPPHLVGKAAMARYGISDPALVHAFSHLDFTASARAFGRMGGFAHLSTLIAKMRAEYADGASILLDGGDTWQGSATALWTRGNDMVEATNLLGVDAMTGHWEFTYPEDEIHALIEKFNGEFLAQNVRLTEDALFEDVPAYDIDNALAFKPYTVRELGGRKLVVIGQAFPYTPIANPQRFIPHWSFGVRADELQSLVAAIRADESPDAVVLLSHNGMDTDRKLASEVVGIDAILGGHTHDAVPIAQEVRNPGGMTIVANGGSHSKFLGVLDLETKNGRVSGYQYRLLPIFPDLLPADAQMQAHIDSVRAPYAEQLAEQLSLAESDLYRRGNFNGSFDQLLCEALLEANDAEIALSPGFRWGPSVPAGNTISVEDVYGQTAMTYPETYSRPISGADLKLIFEDVADNIFNPDPYYQQGGDMVRIAGMNYRINPTAAAGQRIDQMYLANGKPLQADKMYKVAGWSTVGAQSSGEPVWDSFLRYLRARPSVKVDKVNTPEIVGLAGNLGYAAT